MVVLKLDPFGGWTLKGVRIWTYTDRTGHSKLQEAMYDAKVPLRRIFLNVDFKTLFSSYQFNKVYLRSQKFIHNKQNIRQRISLEIL